MPLRALRVGLAWLAACALSSGAFGCTPSPEQTCRRLEDLGRREPGGFSLSWDKCLSRMNEMRQRDPDAYTCAARTVAKQSSINTALLALSMCDGGGNVK